MTNTDAFLDRLEQAVTLTGDDAAIRMHAEYEPQAGPQAKVFPPTYLPDGETRYHLEQRWGADGEPVDVVILDSIQSQANRAEEALRGAAEELGLPQLVMVAELEHRTIRISSLDAPHRSRDAYFIDSEIDGTPFDKTDIGQALARVNADDATAALRYAPYDLIYGVWDSHRGKRMATKFPRVYTSEMLGWHVQRGKRAATKGDPINLKGTSEVPLDEWRPETETGQRKKKNVELNTLGHGMIPGAAQDEAGGVSVRAITRQAVLSLTGLARLHFPAGNGKEADAVGRLALATVALLADRLAFAGAGLSLRSGADLIRTSDRLEWVRAGGETEPLELNVDDARGLVSTAAERLTNAGLGWSGEPVILAPAERLQKVIEQTFYVPELDAEG